MAASPPSSSAPDVAMDGDTKHQANRQEDMSASKKRKITGDDAFSDADAALNATNGLAAQSKKARLDESNRLSMDRSLLPTEIWHHIFSFCPPRTLGNLLMVNKLFNSYLDPASPVVVEKRPPPLAKSVVKVIKPNDIWRNARRTFWPKMPAPLKEKTELDMWRLACSSTCQFCGKRDTRRTFPATDPLRGPGLDGVARVWEFRRVNIAKWEKYDDSGGVANMRMLLHPDVKGQPPTVLEPTQRTELTQSPIKTVEGQKLVSTCVAKPPDAPAKKEKTSEEIDAEWDLIQGPVRLKILRYADEAIIGDWDDGDKVTKDNAPAFAADVLLHVRKRFYTEVENDAKAARAFGREPTVDPVGGPFTQKLTLENLKYVFDVKVKPITSKFRTDLFLCPVCDTSMKFFGFEGAIQHYAAKHTNILSVGNIVVYWRAEWPEDPPFRPNPRTAKGTGLPSDNGRGQVRSNRRRSTSVHLMNHSLEELIKMLVLSPLDRQHSLLFLRLRDQLFPLNIKL
ncbi:hypothetical protein SPBR_01390 [Sporothrix brasiliensis 5110]|uniref:F-box domain-containing protein n=1 Tax=Sporothrix brasiliensis 5110 TaxID=1398154 RepID=A0A0C2EXK7_9PEZI|nr:uncharacterized protein SPBR_01390 [Sporothrix brasiliensis 5110]KIH91354.1 hypothetical protein SPBR_01390 [Sporothrix brasiliensis 5110]